jgi:cytoskeleton protein RodZ
MARPRRRPMRPVPLESADGGRPGEDGAPPGDRFAAPRASFGPWLRAQREARGVSLPEIAEVSKISLRYLEALEQDRFDVLPAPVFVRGFLREYARVVGLDPDEVVNLFLVSMPRSAVERRIEPASAAKGRSAVSRRGPLVFAIVSISLLVAAALGYWLTQRDDPPPPPERAQPAARGRPPETVAGPAIGLPAGSRTASEAPVAAPAPALPPLPGSERGTQPVGESAAAPAPLQLLLEFQQDCWVEVRIDDGRRASELRAGGETMTLEATDAIVLTLGNSTVVRAELNGRPLALPVGETKLLREFRIDRSLLPPSVSPSPPAPPAAPSVPSAGRP